MGKTEALLFEAMSLLDEWDNASGILLRRTYPELEMSFIKRWLEKVPSHLYTYSKSQRKVTWNRTGSTLLFGFCTDDDDVHRYQGAEFDFEAIDELTHFSEYQIKYLLTRLRTSVKGRRPKFFAATNPGGQSHTFVKRWFLDKDFNELELLAGYKPEDFEFIPAFHYDNKYLNPEYVGNLKLQGEREVKMLLEGRWDVFEGKFFDNFSEEVHVVPPFDIPKQWPKFRSIDFGRTAPFACLWFTIDCDGTVWVYDEHYRAGLDVDDHAKIIHEKSGPQTFEYSIIDSAVFSQTGHGESIGQRLARNGIPCIPADKRRVQGWATLKQFLAGDHNLKPKLRIFSNCTSLIHELKNAQTDSKNPEDLDSSKDDHALDALRYFIVTVRDAVALRPKADPYANVDPETRARFQDLHRSRFMNRFRR